MCNTLLRLILLALQWSNGFISEDESAIIDLLSSNSHRLCNFLAIKKTINSEYFLFLKRLSHMNMILLGTKCKDPCILQIYFKNNICYEIKLNKIRLF